MSGDYGFATNDAQMQHLRRILKQHGYNDEVVDTVIARNTEAAAANAAPQHNQTLARLDGRHPAALSGGTCVDGGWNGRLTISGQGPFSTCAEIAHLCDTFR